MSSDDANGKPFRDSLKYVLAVVAIIVLGVASSVVTVVTGTKDVLAKAAIGNLTEVQAALATARSPAKIEGSGYFATVLWFLSLSLLLVVLLFYFRSLRLAASEAQAKGLSTQLTALADDKARLESEARAQTAEIARLGADLTMQRAQGDAAPVMTEYAAMIIAADDVIKGLLDNGQPHFRFTRINEVTSVEPDGTTLVERDYEIECGPTAARNWKFQIFADDSAEKTRLLSEIEFRARAIAERNGESLRHLLHRNESLKKDVTLFFIPPLQPGESRRFRLSYRWPRFAGDLIKRGATTFFATYRTCDPADTAAVTYEIRIDKQIGDIDCTPRLPLQPGARLVIDHTAKDWVWRYEHAAMAMHGGRVELEIKRLEDLPALEAVPT